MTKKQLNTEIGRIRKKLGIRVYNNMEAPPPETSFEALVDSLENDSKTTVLKNIKELGYVKPTAIQAQLIPVIKAGIDSLACAPTGSGKTCALMLPLVCHFAKQHEKPEGFGSVVVCPTNELASQIYSETVKLSNGLVHVNVSVLDRTSALEIMESGVLPSSDILITTPGRLVWLLESLPDALKRCKFLFCDEGDRLWKTGFVEQIDKILIKCDRSSMVKVLASATIDPSVEELANTVLNEPVRVDVGQRNAACSDVDQKLIFAGNEEDKLSALNGLIRKGLSPPCIVFVQSIERAKQLYTEFVANTSRIPVGVIHSEQSPAHRERMIREVRVGKLWVLICTDILARGVDIPAVNTVINYDMPTSGDQYVHRVGRTGRAGRKGVAYTLFTEEDKPMLRTIATIIRRAGSSVPDWMLNLDKTTRKDTRKLAIRPLKRKMISSEGKKKFTKKRKPKNN